jgi:multidrug resistance efflux pump
MTHKAYYVFTVFLVLVFALAACTGSSGNGTPSSADTTPEKSSPRISQSGKVTANGRLVPGKYADLSFASTGQVAEILVQEGAKVNQGDVLARLGDDQTAKAQLAKAEQEMILAQQELDGLTQDLEIAQTDAKDEFAKAQQAEYDAERQVSYQATDSPTFTKAQKELELEIARARLNQAKAKYELLQNGPDPKKLEAAQARHKAAEAGLAEAQALLDQRELKAPFSGVIVDVAFSAGEQVNAGETVMQLADFSEWFIETDDLTEIEAVKVSVGQTVSIVPDALPDVKMTGSVISIKDVFEEKRGDITYTAKIQIDELDPRLRWGMTVAVTFE